MIRGSRTVVRPVENGDFPLFHQWMNDPDISWWMDYEEPFTLTDIESDIGRARKEGLPFTIEFENKPVGRIGLNRFRQQSRLASTYLFIGDPAARGKGLAIDSMTALLGFAFDDRNLRMVDLMVLAENDAAIRTYKACGFREDGRLRERSWKGDRWMDHLWMSITAAEFNALRGTHVDI